MYCMCFALIHTFNSGSLEVNTRYPRVIHIPSLKPQWDLGSLIFLTDKVRACVARFSHALIIVRSSQLRPAVIRGALRDKGQRMERILICREALAVTGNKHTFSYMRGSHIREGSVMVQGAFDFVVAHFYIRLTKLRIHVKNPEGNTFSYKVMSQDIIKWNLLRITGVCFLIKLKVFLF